MKLLPILLFIQFLLFKDSFGAVSFFRLLKLQICSFLESSQNEFVIKSFESCPGNFSGVYQMTSNSSDGLPNRIRYSGILNVVNDIFGPLELWVEINRCDIAMKNCEKFPTQKFNRLCQRLTDTNTFYYGAVSTVEPKLACPLRAQRYTSTNSTLDLSVISMLPLSGSVFMGKMWVMSGEGKKSEMVQCATIELMIVRAKAKKRH